MLFWLFPQTFFYRIFLPVLPYKKGLDRICPNNSRILPMDIHAQFCKIKSFIGTLNHPNIYLYELHCKAL